MSKFKVVADTLSHALPIGSIVELVLDDGTDAKKYRDEEGSTYWVPDEDLVPVEEKPAGKFKVGDRVRIVHTDYTTVGLDIGGVHDVVYVGNNIVGLIGSDHGTWYFNFPEVEPIPTARFKIGEAYTSRNGVAYKCINVNEDGSAHLYMGQRSVAYLWDADGRSLSLSYDWDIVFPPEVSTHYHKVYAHGEERETRYNLVDGKVDWSSLEILPCA